MPNNQLITNQNKFLHEVINNILPSSQNLFFLVGYFYFSGFQVLYENLRDKHLKIPVGMDIEKDIALLEGIRDNWFKRGEISHDPKLDHFASVAGDMLRKEPLRKLVVYTSYADTANYLYDRLKDSLRVFKYRGSDATRENKRMIKENFDAGWPTQKNNYDLLKGNLFNGKRRRA